MADEYGVVRCIEWVVDSDRNFRGKIAGGSGKDKKPFRVAVLEGLESSVRNQLHVKQYIDHAFHSFKSHSHLDPNPHTPTSGDTNQLLHFPLVTWLGPNDASWLPNNTPPPLPPPNTPMQTSSPLLASFGVGVGVGVQGVSWGARTAVWWTGTGTPIGNGTAMMGPSTSVSSRASNASGAGVGDGWSWGCFAEQEVE
jgi:hypothetical protein